MLLELSQVIVVVLISLVAECSSGHWTFTDECARGKPCYAKIMASWDRQLLEKMFEELVWAMRAKVTPRIA